MLSRPVTHVRHSALPLLLERPRSPSVELTPTRLGGYRGVALTPTRDAVAIACRVPTPTRCGGHPGGANAYSMPRSRRNSWHCAEPLSKARHTSARSS